MNLGIAAATPRGLLVPNIKNANELSLNGTAENFSLPIDAVVEIVRYCETNQELLKMEADEERCRLEEKGLASIGIRVK